MKKNNIKDLNKNSNDSIDKKTTSNIKWINIKDEAPPNGIPVLFYSLNSKAYHVGYWNEYENGMSQYDPSTKNEGWIWDVIKWAYIL